MAIVTPAAPWASHPVAKVGFRLYNAVSEDPIWMDLNADGDETAQGVSHTLGFADVGALNQQAILFRTSHHSATLEIELTRRNIPFVKFGGLKFLDTAHVKDLLALLRFVEMLADSKGMWPARRPPHRRLFSKAKRCRRGYHPAVAFLRGCRS